MGVKVTAFTGFGLPTKWPAIQKGSVRSQEGCEHWGLSVSNVCQMLPDVKLHEGFLPLLSWAWVPEVSWWNIQNGRATLPKMVHLLRATGTSGPACAGG